MFTFFTITYSTDVTKLLTDHFEKLLTQIINNSINICKPIENCSNYPSCKSNTPIWAKETEAD